VPEYRTHHRTVQKAGG